MVQEAYDKARRDGVRTAKSRYATGASPYLPVLEEMHANVEKQEPLGLQTIPLDHVAGTLTKGRTNAFAADWMPLLDPDSEFASKWSRLYESQLEEGIREPILAYEYLNRYYVQEGNKRVSVLKFLHQPEIQAKVIRLLPRPDGTREVDVYLEGVKLARKSGLPVFDFTMPGSSKKLEDLVTEDGVWTEDLVRDVESAYSRFSSLFDKKGGQALKLSAADAFLVFLEIYGLEDFDQVGGTQLEAQVDKIWPDFQVWPKKPGMTLRTDTPEEERPHLFSYMKEPVKFAFINEKDPETSSWTRNHEAGRLYLANTQPDIETKAWFHADTDEEEMKAMEEAVDEGYNVLFTTSPNMLQTSIRFGALHPEIKVFNCSIHPRTGHIRTYFHREYESQFLTGILAGILSKTGHIGYVADYPIYGNIASINAFALGARMVCPDAVIHLDWSTTKSSITPMPKEIDLTYVAGIEFDAAVKNNKSFGLYDLGKEKFLNLTRDLQYWGEFYTRIARKIKNSKWNVADRNLTSANWYWGASNGMVDMALTDAVPAPTRQLVRLVKERLKDGYNPFEEEVADQHGKVHKGETYQDIVEMDWLAGNIVGRIPHYNEFTDSAREIIKSHGIAKVRDDRA